MLKYWIDVRGVDRVANKYRKMAAKFAHELDDVIGDWTKDKRNQLEIKPYPPERPNQTYIRTGTLGASWTAEKQKDAVWSLVNAAEQRGRMYACYVVFKLTQAWMHKDRWWTVQDETAPSPELTNAIMDRLKDLMR